MNDDDIQHFYETVLSTFELGNYDIKLEVLPRIEMDDKCKSDDNFDGLIYVNPKHETATISLCDDLDSERNAWPKSPEGIS